MIDSGERLLQRETAVSKHVLLAVEDLLVQNSVIEGAKALGIEVERVRTAEDAIRVASAKPPAGIFLKVRRGRPERG